MNTNLALKFEPDYTDEALAFGRGNIIQTIKDDYTKLVVKKSGKQNSLQHYKLLYNGEGKDGRKFLIGIKEKQA